ncbi:uncharacterized protein ACIQIH_000886 [Cyanocitta cristata]
MDWIGKECCFSASREDFSIYRRNGDTLETAHLSSNEDATPKRKEGSGRANNQANVYLRVWYHGIEGSEMLPGDLGPQERQPGTGCWNHYSKTHSQKHVGFKLQTHSGKMEGFSETQVFFGSLKLPCKSNNSKVALKVFFILSAVLKGLFFPFVALEMMNRQYLRDKKHGWVSPNFTAMALGEGGKGRSCGSVLAGE